MSFLGGLGAGLATGAQRSLDRQRAEKAAELSRRWDFYVKNVAPEIGARNRRAASVAATETELNKRGFDPAISSWAAINTNGDLGKAFDMANSPAAENLAGREPLPISDGKDMGEGLGPKSSIDEQIAFVEGRREQPQAAPVAGQQQQQPATSAGQPQPKKDFVRGRRPPTYRPTKDTVDLVESLIGKAPVADQPFLMGQFQIMQTGGAAGFEAFGTLQGRLGRLNTKDNLSIFNEVSKLGQSFGITPNNMPAFSSAMLNGNTEKAMSFVPKGSHTLKFDNAFIDDIAKASGTRFEGDIGTDKTTGSLTVSITGEENRARNTFDTTEASMLGRILVGEKGQNITPTELVNTAMSERLIIEDTLLSAKDTQEGFSKLIKKSDAVHELNYLEKLLTLDDLNPSLSGKLDSEQKQALKAEINKKRQRLSNRSDPLNKRSDSADGVDVNDLSQPITPLTDAQNAAAGITDKGDSPEVVSFENLSAGAQTIMSFATQEERVSAFKNAPQEVKDEILEFIEKNKREK